MNSPFPSMFSPSSSSSASPSASSSSSAGETFQTQQQQQQQQEQWNRTHLHQQSQSQSHPRLVVSSSDRVSSVANWNSTLHPPMPNARSGSHNTSSIHQGRLSNSSSPAAGSPLITPNATPTNGNGEYRHPAFSTSPNGGGNRTFNGAASSTTASNTSGSSTPAYFSSNPASSVSPSPSGSPSPSPDPLHSRSHDPVRIQALIQVIQQLADSGVTQKFLSQLGIVFKQLHPNLFVKGILKELVDHASHCGLLTLSGPAGQQQVELTVAGKAIAQTWRLNHETVHQQQLASLKETLQMHASSHFDSTSSSSSASAGGNFKSSHIGLSFLDDPDSTFPPTTRGVQSLNNTGGSSINNTSSSINTTASSIHSSAPASLNNTGAGNNNLISHHLDSSNDLINTTSGTFTSHPKDSARLDLNNIFGVTSSSIFGVTDAEDSELLSSYHDADLNIERYRSKSPQNTGADAHSSFTLLNSTGGGGGSHSTNSTGGNNGFGSYHSQASSTSTPSTHYTSLLGPSGRSSHSGSGSNVGVGSQYNTNTFGVNSSSHDHLHTPHPVQSHINGSNMYQFLGSSTTTPYQPHQQQQANHTQSYDPVLPDPSALQLLPPLPTSLEEKSFRGERLKHLKYIFHFRVHPCLNFLQKGSCPFDNKNECFDYHSLKTRRRIPRIYSFSNGVFWSYNACRCQAIEKEMRCEKGEGCRYAHCFEDSTQILTERGFMFRHQLEAAEKSEEGMPLIATYNSAAAQIEYQAAAVQSSGSQIYQVDASHGPFSMVEFGSPQDRADWSSDASVSSLSPSAVPTHRTGLLVTSRHTMWAARATRAPFEKTLAEDLIAHTNDDEDKQQHIRMEATIKNGLATPSEDHWRKLEIANVLEINTETQLLAVLEIYGYLLVGGTIDSDSSISFGGRGVDCQPHLQSLCHDAGLEPYEYYVGRTCQISRPSWCKYIARQLQHSRGEIPHWTRQLSKEQVRKFIAGIHLSSGSINAHGCSVVHTSSASFRDALMPLMLHAGFSAIFHANVEPNSNSDAASWRIEYSDSTIDSGLSQPTFDPATDIVQRNHDGSVWCVTVPNGLIIARRAKVDKHSEVTFASRAVIVGNCKEEIAYHPSRYKTQRCSYPLRADGSCSRFGLHCAFSHGDNDVRKPIVLKQGMPHKLVEPSLHMLQEQQQLSAALTGLSLAELNGFSMSGHNNSMSFGGGGNGSSSTNNTGGSSHSSMHQQSIQSYGADRISQTQPPQHMTVSVSHPALNAHWEQQQQQQQQQQSSSHSSSSLSHSHHHGLHSTDSPPLHYDKYSVGRTSTGSSHSISLTAPPSSSSSHLSVNSGLATDLTYGTAPNSPSLQSLNSDPAFLASLDSAQYMCPPEELASEREYYLYAYKTNACKNQTLACTKGECPNFHYQNKRRRNPRVYRYSHEACVVVRPPVAHGSAHHDSSVWRRPDSCRLGDACEFSHTLLESMYHPMVYKTVLCQNFHEHDRTTWQRCPWKRACAHAHSRAELEYAEACVREGAQANRNGSMPSSTNNTTGGGVGTNSHGDAAWPTSTPSHTRTIFYDSGSQAAHAFSNSDSTLKPPSAENALPGIAADGTQVQFPSHGSHQQQQQSHSQVGGSGLAYSTESDHSMRSVLLKQDTAARILRMQQQQLQPAASNAVSPSNPSPSTTLMPNSSIVETLRSENVHLLDRLSRYEKELYMLKHRLDDKDAMIKTLQWTVDTEREEKVRAQQQLEAFRQEITQRIMQQQQQQQQQQSHHLHGDSELHHGHAASEEMALSVLGSPTDGDSTASTNTNST